MLSFPFLVINPKNFLNKEELFQLAHDADEIAVNTKVKIILTSPFTYLYELKKSTKHILIAAQHVDYSSTKDSMGKITPENLSEINVDVAVLNHAENRLSLYALDNILDQLNKMNIKSIVCCDSVREAKSVAMLDPTVILCEQTDLIGTEVRSSLSYVKETNEEIKKINPNVLVEHGAGIRTANDVFQIMRAGSDGVGATSAFVNSNNRKQTILEFIKAIEKAINGV